MRCCDVRSGMSSKQWNPKGCSSLALSSGQCGQQGAGVQTEAGNSRIAAALVKPPAWILTSSKFI